MLFAWNPPCNEGNVFPEQPASDTSINGITGRLVKLTVQTNFAVYLRFISWLEISSSDIHKIFLFILKPTQQACIRSVSRWPNSCSSRQNSTVMGHSNQTCGWEEQQKIDLWFHAQISSLTQSTEVVDGVQREMKEHLALASRRGLFGTVSVVRGGYIFCCLLNELL